MEMSIVTFPRLICFFKVLLPAFRLEQGVRNGITIVFHDVCILYITQFCGVLHVHINTPGLAWTTEKHL